MIRNTHKIPIPLGHSFLRMMAKENPVVVNYHMVSDQDLPYVTSLYRYPSVLEFTQHVRYYKQHYRVIHMDELLEHVQGGKALPENALMITFDDGFREVYDHVAPVLKAENVPASFFICPEFLNNHLVNHDNRQSLLVNMLESQAFEEIIPEVSALLGDHQVSGSGVGERILSIPYKKRNLIEEIAGLAGIDLDAILKEYRPYLSDGQVKELVEMGFSVGGHSLDHARFVELALEEQINQALESVNRVREKFNIPYRVFAFPYTDIGVSPAFFEHISDKLDIVFGTQGFMDDPLPFSFQRINAEKFGFSARRNLKYQFARKIIKKGLGRNQIRRS